jgi:glutamate carboxypeptidase
MYDKASRDIGAGAVEGVDPSRAGAADVSFIAHLVPMIIDGIGLSGHDDHSAKETADLRKLPSQTKRAALVLNRLANGADKPQP